MTQPTNILRMPDEVSQCVVCNKPLGQESKDLGFFTCKDHRACAICTQPVSPHEIRSCYLEVLETLNDNPESTIQSTPISELITIQHARCSSVTRKSAEQDPSVALKQSYLDYLNNARLLIEPDVDLSRESNEKLAGLAAEKWLADKPLDYILLFLRRMESIVAHTSIRLRKDRKVIEAELDKRERAKFAAAQRDAATSSRPAAKKSDDSDELAIAAFMRDNHITDRKTAQKKMKDRQKAMDHLIKLGLTEEAALESINKNMKLK